MEELLQAARCVLLDTTTQELEIQAAPNVP